MITRCFFCNAEDGIDYKKYDSERGYLTTSCRCDYCGAEVVYKTPTYRCEGCEFERLPKTGYPCAACKRSYEHEDEYTNYMHDSYNGCMMCDYASQDRAAFPCIACTRNAQHKDNYKPKGKAKAKTPSCDEIEKLEHEMWDLDISDDDREYLIDRIKGVLSRATGQMTMSALVAEDPEILKDIG